MLRYRTSQPVLSRVLTPPAAERPEKPLFLIASIAAMTVAAILAAIWFWSRICRFPAIAWNDMRLAPTIALFQGHQVYPSSTEGTVGTWMYGPLPVLFFWPASLAPSAGTALMIAAILNLVLTIVPIALVALRWPASEQGRDSQLGRFAMLLLCLVIWPELHYSVHFSDNLAVALGLIGNLVLVRTRRATGLWIAAIAGTAAIACKQIAIGIPVAQIIWLAVTEGRRAASLHAGRCLVAGIAIGALSIGIFGLPGLWFTLIEVPAAIGWASNPLDRIQQIAPAILLQIGAPLLVMLTWRNVFRQNHARLAALAWGCTLPLGIAGLMKLGGWTNSVHSFVLWLPPALVCLVTSNRVARHRHSVCLGCGVAAVAILAFRIVDEKDFFMRPQIAAYREADRLAAANPGKLWFPLNPLVTLFREHRYYHDEDGFYVRQSTNKVVSSKQLASQLPPAMDATVFRYGVQDWGIARGMFPAYTQNTDLPHWTIWSTVTYPMAPAGQKTP